MRDGRVRQRLSGAVIDAAIVIAIVAAAAVAMAARSAATELSETPDYRLTVLAEGLEHPWSMAFLPDGDLLVTEREGRLRIIRDGVLDPEPIAGVPPVFARGQGGLFDVLLHPRFNDNSIIYLSYAHGDRRANATRLARARLDGRVLNDLEVIFEVRPTKDTPAHFGGRMMFLPDGTLLLTTGDGFEYREQAQNLQSLLGKTVRLHDDGSIPDDNPFVGRADVRAELWSYGHRNPQGLALHAPTGEIFLHEHGPRGGDEFHLLRPGRNYGWPLITYGLDYTGAHVTPFTHMDGLEQPLHYWEQAIAPAGLTWYDGDRFPDWRGDFLIAALVDRSVRRLRLDVGVYGSTPIDDASRGHVVVEEETLFSEIGERMRDVRTGPDGYIYLLTDSPQGQVVRVD